MKKSGASQGQSASELISKRIAELGDWRGETLGRMRKLIKEADPDVVEEWKWVKPTKPGTPVWSHDGIICTGTRSPSGRPQQFWQVETLAYRLLHVYADPCLFGGRQLLQREGDGPHGTFVEVRLVAEAERRVPGVEFLRALEKADDLAVLGIGGHSVPESRRESWRACFDDSMEPFAHGAFRFRHLSDLREDGVFPVCLVRLQLLDALLHRDSFLFRESLELLDRKSTRLNSSHSQISYAVFCLKKKKKTITSQ